MAEEGFSTKAIHTAAYHTVFHGDPLSYPIFQTSSFGFESLEELDAFYEEPGSGFAYSRAGNPTVNAFESVMAHLEGAEAACAFASGMGAISATILSFLKSGDHMIVTRDLYGGTYSLVTKIAPQFGVTCSLIDMTDLTAIEAAIRPETKLIWGETVSNPTTVVLDIPSIAKLAHAHGLVFGVDATFTTPYLSLPIAQGADLSVHSATKYISGHGDVIGGVVSGPQKLLEKIHFMMTTLGSNMQPLEAYLLLRGLKTLEIRMDRQAENALKTALALQNHPNVERVYYPGLPSHPQYALSQALLRNSGGFLSFTVQGGLVAARQVVNNLRMVKRSASLGDAHSLASLPIMTSPRLLSPAARAEAGVTDNMVRAPIGLENSEDIIADYVQALDRLGN